MAVGACENRVGIYALKTMEQMRSEVQSSQGLDARNFMPIREVVLLFVVTEPSLTTFVTQEKHAVVDGIILKMEFLHPSKGDENHVILLLIVSKDAKTRLVRFEWDWRSSLHELEKKPAQPLQPAHGRPSLLIPLTYGTAFALVCGHEIVVYRDILTGNATSGQSCQLEHCEPPQEPGSSRKLAIWTQWARPMRPLQRSDPTMDNIYLCREDGVVRYIDIREDTNTMVSSNYKAGILKANLGSAFATLDLGDESNDLLVAAGEMGDGGMWYFAPRQPLDLVGTIRDWTPLRDIATASTSASDGNSAREGTSVLGRTKRLFACTGWGPRYGTISELRVGVEAVKLGPTIDVGELAQNGVVDMWALPDRSNTGIYLMVAHPTDTELILLPSSNDQDPRAVSEIEELDLDARTLAAGNTADGFLIQVTSSSINAIAQDHGVLPFTSNLGAIVITAACFLTIPARTTVLLMIMQKQDDFYLHHGHFGIRNSRIAFEELGKPILLRSEASCVSMQWIDDRIVAFVGTSAGTLQCYTAEPGSSFTPYYEYKFDGRFPTCDSIAMITYEKKVSVTIEESLVVCGLRDGTIQALFFNKDIASESSS